VFCVKTNGFLKKCIDYVNVYDKDDYYDKIHDILKCSVLVNRNEMILSLLYFFAIDFHLYSDMRLRCLKIALVNCCESTASAYRV